MTTINLTGKTMVVTFSRTGVVRTIVSETYAEMRQTLAEIVARFPNCKINCMDT